MILLIDTSTDIFKIDIVDHEGVHHYDEIETNRNLAKNIQKIIVSKLENLSSDINDLTGIVVFRGPGSFTGLRIGISVGNSLAKALDIPIVGSSGESWKNTGIEKLHSNKNEHMILPIYSSDARVSRPKK